jgi:pimeloyl-ACP methyl ester carboxylesterase
MRRFLKIAGFVLVSLVALLGLAIAGALTYRSHLQHEHSVALRIRGANGIDESRFVEVGGLRQWIRIRGEDRANPVLLFVHGGPALSMIPFTYRSMRAWESYFTIVQWDQRGAGRTYLLNGGADTTATGMTEIIDDGVRVAQFARQHLHKERIILVGESWGSGVALEMARARPDLFYAYVGTGQIVNMRRGERLTYDLLLDRVRAEHDERAARQLASIGPPPYADPQVQTAEQLILGRHPPRSELGWGMGVDFLTAPGYTLHESSQLLGGATQHRSGLVRDAENYDAPAHGAHFEVPIFFFQGAEDIQAPTQLVADYLQQIEAPSKALVLFPQGGHNSYYFFSGRFLEELNARVRPLALAARAPQ